MKRIATLTMLFIPAMLYAQESANELTFSNLTAMIVVLFFFLLMIIALLLICRTPICWYFKINHILEQQKEIIELLNKQSKDKK